MFCTKCGKEIAEGEACTCEQTAQTAQPIAPQQETPAQQAAPAPSSAPAQPASKLPDGQALAESAKKAAEAIKNNPIFAEVLSTAKGVIVSPVKQVSANAARKDILWVLLAVIEILLIPFAVTTVLRRSLYIFVSGMFGAFGNMMGSFGGMFGSSGLELKYGDYSKMLSTLGASSVKMYFLFMLASVICILASIGLIKLLMVVCKKTAPVSVVANMVTTVLLPFSMLMTLGGIFSMIYVPIGLVFAVAAIFVLAVLGYVGVQKLDKFTSSPFWQYIIVAAAIFIVVLGAGGIVLNGIISGMTASGLTSDLMDSLGGLGSLF